MAEIEVQALASAGRRLPAQFTVGLTLTTPASSLLETAATPAGGVTLACREVLRLLPGRRLVARVEVAGETAVMKLFLGRGARRYRDREARGCASLAAAGVATPTLLGALEAPDGVAYALLFEYLAGAVPVAPSDQEGVMAAAGQLGCLHQAGYRYRDLHLDNFLKCSDGTVHVIDGDGVRDGGRPGQPLGLRRSLQELGVLCAQRPPLADDRLDAVYQAYAAARDWGRHPGLAALAAATRRQRQARVRRYLAKAQRDCTEYRQQRSWRQWIVAVRETWDGAMAGFADEPEAAFVQAQMLKDGNSATVVRARIGEHWRVVKRYNVKGPWHAVRRALKPRARFRLAWLNGQRLHFLEIPTARPLALVEQRFGPWRSVAYLVMEDLGDDSLASEVDAVGLTDRRLAQVTTLFRALDAAGLTHGDTKASNFLITPDGVALVDLDAMHDSRGDRDKDRQRFLANFDDRPEVRERFRAALAAAGTGGFAAASRSL